MPFFIKFLTITCVLIILGGIAFLSIADITVHQTEKQEEINVNNE